LRQDFFSGPALQANIFQLQFLYQLLEFLFIFLSFEIFY